LPAQARVIDRLGDAVSTPGRGVAALKAENADLRAKNQQTRNPAPRGSSSRSADATWSTPLCPTTRN
jgi:hypothetical protein